MPYTTNMNANTTSSRGAMVPEAKAALNNMKYEIANELGVNLKQGYNGDLTSRDAGSVGGYMVNNMSTIRSTECARINRVLDGHVQIVRYACVLTI